MAEAIITEHSTLLVNLPYGVNSTLPVQYPVARPSTINPFTNLTADDRQNLADILSASPFHPHVAMKGRALACGVNITIGEDELGTIDTYILAWETVYFAQVAEQMGVMALGMEPIRRNIYLHHLRELVRGSFVPHMPPAESDFLNRIGDILSHQPTQGES